MQSNKSLVFYLANEDKGEATPPALPDAVLAPEVTLVPAHPQEAVVALATTVVSASQAQQADAEADVALMVDPDWFVHADNVAVGTASEFLHELDEADAVGAEGLHEVSPKTGLTRRQLEEQSLDDWIAELESLRDQRRHEEALEANAVVANPHFGQVEKSALSGVLKVTSVKATQLYQPAAQAIAAGKDLDTISHNMQVAKHKATEAAKVAAQAQTESKTAPVEILVAATPAPMVEESLQADPVLLKQPSTNPAPTPEPIVLESLQAASALPTRVTQWAPETAAVSEDWQHHVIEPTAAPVKNDALLGAGKKSSTLSLQDQMAQVKQAAKQVPIGDWHVAPVKVSASQALANEETIDAALMAKAEEVAQKTALTPEEKNQILDGYLSLWHSKQTDATPLSERKVAFKEAWLQRNESILQADAAVEQQAETVMWLKTSPEVANDTLSVASSSDVTEFAPEIMAHLPEQTETQAMYAPIHVHITMPKDNEGVRIISEAQLLSQLTARLQPYFVDMLTGLVKTELTKQTHLLVQRLQENIASEIPIMVDEVLQENLKQVLSEINSTNT